MGHSRKDEFWRNVDLIDEKICDMCSGFCAREWSTCSEFLMEKGLRQ